MPKFFLKLFNCKSICQLNLNFDKKMFTTLDQFCNCFNLDLPY